MNVTKNTVYWFLTIYPIAGGALCPDCFEALNKIAPTVFLMKFKMLTLLYFRLIKTFNNPIPKEFIGSLDDFNLCSMGFYDFRIGKVVLNKLDF